jgi:hypothetical protein
MAPGLEFMQEGELERERLPHRTKKPESNLEPRLTFL